MSSTSSSVSVLAASNSKNEPLPSWRIEIPVDMGSALWSNSKYKDFQIIAGDRAIRVHKCVLASRSPVFATMFQSGLTETQSGQMVIQDFDFETVQNAIWILYSERFVINYSTQIICDLLGFGHKYDIKQLINTCLDQILSLRDSYDSSEKEFLIKSAESLGSDQILNDIKTIIERPPWRKLNFSLTAIGDALAKDDSFKDMKIICDGQEFFVHKCILALRSPVFAQIFDKMAEDGDTSGQIKIDRVKPAVVQKAVEILYTGRISTESGKNEAFENALLGLLEFADRFRMTQLVNFCLQKINESKDDLGQEVIFTFMQSAANFESKKIFKFILGIFGTQGFENFKFEFEKASKESYWN